MHGGLRRKGDATRARTPRAWGMVLALGPWVVAAILVRPAGATTPFVNETADGSANDVGEYTSLALDASGNPHVSYADITTFDLKYARKSGGVWTIEMADGSANLVGLYTSLALDASGNPHVSYYDFTVGNLKYARKSGGAWTIETADGSANDVGFYTSLALDALGNPHVSYQDNTTDDLKYARKSGGVWTIETADGSANSVGLYTSLSLDASGNPHVGYQDDTTDDLKYAQKSGGVWTRETADGSANSVGHYTSLSLDASGNPHVSHFDLNAGDLKYARKSGGVWTLETADGSASNVGPYTSLALDASGNPHVSYFDNTIGTLKYARKSEGVWMLETADGSAGVGGYTSLALDSQGNPHVSHKDAASDNLKYAHAAVRTIAPSAGVTWAVGSLQSVAWSGIGLADLLLSVDGGRTFDVLLRNLTENAVAIRVPHAPTRFARIRIQRDTPFSTSDTDSFFTIDATIALAKFEAIALSKDDAASAGTGGVGDENDRRSAIRLRWDTTPRPPTIAGYRVERAAAGGAAQSTGGDFEPIHPGLLRDSELIDRDAGGAPRYRLIAVNGLDEEYVLGEASPAQVLRSGDYLAVSPNPAPGGATRVRYRVIDDAAPIELAVYDPSGRRVRTIDSGAFGAGVRSAAWDGRDERGNAVAAGVYVLRLSWRFGGGGSVSERIVVVR